MDAEGSIGLTKAWDAVSQPSHVDIASVLTGRRSAMALLIGLGRTRLSLFSSLIALIIPTAGVLLLHADDVADVDDVGSIPSGLPLPQALDFGLLSVSIISGAFAVAAIVLVQGAGVAEAAPNPSGERSRPNRDFSAQGIGNIGSAIFAGQPVGGSVGQTALNVSAGAKSRWGSIWSGVWMLVILAMFAGIVGKVAMPTLSAVLIFAAVGSLRPGQLLTIWKTGPSSKVALATTFAATLTLPVTAAVGVGVALSLLLQLNQEAVDLKIVRLIPEADGRLVEAAVPRALGDRDVVILDVYGSLFYAGSRTLQVLLPDPSSAEAPAVILRLRGRTTLGATFFSVIADYARRLESRGGQLYMSGLSEDLLAYWQDDRLEGRTPRSTPTCLGLVGPAVGVLLIAFAEGLGAAKTYAVKEGYEIDANRELAGLGASNLGAGLMSGMVVNGSLSKTAVNGSAGAKSQVSGLVVAALTVLTLLFLTGLFEQLPEAVLAAVVIAAVIELVDFASIRRLYGIWSGPSARSTSTPHVRTSSEPSAR